MVLLVDDNEDLLEVLGLLLERHKVPHLMARSLAEVQEQRAQLDQVTVAILDINLGPKQPTGLDIARWMHAEQLPARIVFMSGHAADHPLVSEVIGEQGEVLAKPVDSKLLVRIARGSR